MLIIEHINAQSLMSCFDEVNLMIKERNLDILCVSETWLLPHTPDRFVTIPNFNVFRNDSGRGGGVCIFVKDTLNAKVLTLPINSRAEAREVKIEDIFVTVQSCMFPSIIIGCIYRHPKAPAESFDYIRNLFRSLCISKKNFFILGDINDNLLAPGNKLKNVIRSHGLTQLIEKPTRVTNTSATLLDVIITNNPKAVSSHDVVPSSVSDHDLITITVNVRKPKRQEVVRTFRHLGHYTKDIFCLSLVDQSYKLDDIILTDNVNDQVQIFNQTFIKCLDNHAPLVTRTMKRPPAPWIDDKVRQAMEQRNAIQYQLKFDRRNSLIQQEFKNRKKSVKAIIKAAKSEYYHKKIKETKGNAAGTCNIIRNIIPNGKNVPKSIIYENIHEKAEEFNKFFSNVGKDTFEQSERDYRNIQNIQPHEYITNINDKFQFRPQPVDICTVILTIKHLKESKSIGSDGIQLSFIKDSLYVTAIYLTCIINTSIVTGIVPDAWKHAIVVPLHKKDDVNNLSNYRPISILPILSKVLEKIIAKQLFCYLDSNSLLSKTQHGFRPRLSIETALSTICDAIYENMDNKRISLLTLCDLSKAFDSVNHNFLLKKCANLGVDSFWFNDYLNKRSQSVRLAKTVSSKENVSFGVPQGSVLGPVLFAIYVNDLCLNVQDCVVVQYADDTQLLHSDSLDNLNTLIRKTEASLLRTQKYFLRNGLC